MVRKCRACEAGGIEPKLNLRKLLPRSMKVRAPPICVPNGECIGIAVAGRFNGSDRLSSLRRLMSMGCEEGQGYFFGRPMPAHAFETQFLAAREPAAEAGEAA
jgi:hypothetical protein